MWLNCRLQWLNCDCFVIKVMYYHFNERYAMKAPLIVDDIYEIIIKNVARLDSEIIYDRDFDYDYFGFKTLERSYILKVQGKVVERPQHMLMRVVVGIHKDDIDSAVRTYHMMSQRWFTHASPTLFNTEHLGLRLIWRPYVVGSVYVHWQLSSCFLVCMKDYSIEGIYDTLKECVVISKSAGGIGVSIHNIHATGSYICATPGTSNGIVPMLRVFNDTARYVDQGGGKRKGAFVVKSNVLEIFFYALWVSDIFMERVQSNGQWSLFCPNEVPGVIMEFHPTKLVGSRGSKNRYFDFDKLEEVTAMVTTNLNKIIDVNYYPVDTAFVELLFDLQFKLDAQQLNKDIFQTIYYHALKTSSELAAKEGPYETFSGSPISKVYSRERLIYMCLIQCLELYS
ncbi:Ribonucleoside-diphosphate reductase large subunit [Glycine max]|nr:Ribonucleoside-diphosphate reductase large subunit [Glycine max]